MSVYGNVVALREEFLAQKCDVDWDWATKIVSSYNIIHQPNISIRSAGQHKLTNINLDRPGDRFE
ncbi:MAG: hypothetical protein RID09_13820 [Coleofasciculus sp. G1-WW12-02]|uniref:hypothetical protein n=1 Tax=Coleofasciculus sp. G1-WW12-02 TaxID=3068483 RepID=UPI0032FF00F0